MTTQSVILPLNTIVRMAVGNLNRSLPESLFPCEIPWSSTTEIMVLLHSDHLISTNTQTNCYIGKSVKNPAGILDFPILQLVCMFLLNICIYLPTKSQKIIVYTNLFWAIFFSSITIFIFFVLYPKVS